MPHAQDTRAVVEAFFYACARNDVDTAYALLAPDMKFHGPAAHYTSAEQFRPALVGFCAITRAARLAEILIDGERAAILYDCDMVPPGGTSRIAAFYRVEHGKIRWYELCFDPAGVQRLLSASQRLR